MSLITATNLTMNNNNKHGDLGGLDCTLESITIITLKIKILLKLNRNNFI